MKNYIFGLTLLLLFAGCAHEHQINIGDITLQKRTTNPLKQQEYYMSFTQEYYDNKKYPLSNYCDDQRSYLSDDKFSTETYLKITNERTKESRVGKYPIWFLLNDDASNISCVKKSANFINAEPFVVSSSDKLSVSFLQKNEAAQSVPIRELGVLIDFVSLVVPHTANFLLRTNNIIKDPITQNYLNTMDEAFKRGDLDGTKSHSFKTDVSNIKVKLYVPNKEGRVRELGYILLKPKYRTTLTTVNTINGIPNFRFIYNSNDPRIVNLMNYELPNRDIKVKMVVDNFKQIADEYLIEALASLNRDLVNRFTRYDRALVLNIALRNSDFYRRFVESIRAKEIVSMKRYMKILSSKLNPLQQLTNELKATKCEYYALLYQAQEVIKNSNILAAQESAEAQRIKEEALNYQIEMQGIENFLRPVANWKYLPQMFTKNIKIFKTTGEELTVNELIDLYDKKNVKAYGCYVALQKGIKIQLTKSLQKRDITVQNYLIHPNYSRGTKYDYMAISLNKKNEVDTFFYKFSKGKNSKVEEILIDSSNLFINKNRIKEIIKGNMVYGCSNSIRRVF